MIEYLLDTSVCVDVIRKRNPGALERMESAAGGTLGLSSIALAELEHGVHKSSNPDRNQLALLQFCALLKIVPFDDAAAAAYGSIRANLEGRGMVIGPMDCLIAAQAVTLGITLVTGNVREFERVQGIKVETWG